MMGRFFSTTILLLIIGGAGFMFRDQVRIAAVQIYARIVPCGSPLTYSIGSIDPHFGMSREQYLSAIRSGAAIWEKGSERTLYEYVPDKGSVVINLVYDYRQQAIDKLKKVGITIDDTRGSYDELKTKYDSLKNAYEPKKAALELHIKDFQLKQDAYNTLVHSWNARGGVTKDVYADLQAQKAELDIMRSQIESEQNNFNSDVETINALATSLNHLAGLLNIQVAKYNAIGQSTGGEFEEGVYESRLGERKIDIYEFSNRAELVRVLAHELGHALGLEHVDDKNAIMYKLNQSTNGYLAPADLKELERVCGAES